MASNGILNRAKRGTCHICQRTRKTDTHIKAVGEIHHGFATGYIWECRDTIDCDNAAHYRLQNLKLNGNTRGKIKASLEHGRFTEYVYRY